MYIHICVYKIFYCYRKGILLPDGYFEILGERRGWLIFFKARGFKEKIFIFKNCYKDIVFLYYK